MSKELTLRARSIWAKKSRDHRMQWLPLHVHHEDCAAAAGWIWRVWLPDGVKERIQNGVTGGRADQLLIFLAAIHDLGKATPIFQVKSCLNAELDEMIEERLRLAGVPLQPSERFVQPRSTPHALASQLLLEELLKPTHRKYARSITCIASAHHGKPADSNDTSGGVEAHSANYYLNKKADRQIWQSVQREFVDYALRLSGLTSLDQVPIPDICAQVLLTGLLIMSDWLASNEEYFPYIDINEDPDQIDMAARLEAASERMAFLETQWIPDSLWMRKEHFETRFPFAPNAFQRAAAETAANLEGAGIIIMEAPMGIGKTEAALAAAEILCYTCGRSGIFFALPTQATSDGVFPRMLDWIARLGDGLHSIELIHGKAQFNETAARLRHFSGSENIFDEDNDIDGAALFQWFSGSKKALLADFAVGTVDQLLLAALRKKHLMLRHLGLANKVIIVDECHAYDAYMNVYLERALHWLGAYGVPVIMLSATLPSEKRRSLIAAYNGCEADDSSEWARNRDYPIITASCRGNTLQRHVNIPGRSRLVHTEYISDQELADILPELLSDGGCAGIITNTVARAQTIAAELSQRFGPDAVRLIHSRFIATDRAAKESELRRELGKPSEDNYRPHIRIVVGTQVLEQSLDIDFDILITDLCPVDLLLQRIGRLHRHERQRPEKLRDAMCYITGTENGSPLKPSCRIYGEYLLARTIALLPESISLPDDIPRLVEEVYNEAACDVRKLPADHDRMKNEHIKGIEDKEARADVFRVRQVYNAQRENMTNLLSMNIPVSDAYAEAAVRDTGDSLEVLTIVDTGCGFCLADGTSIPDGDLDNDTARLIACQSLRLPPRLCAHYNIDATIRRLEENNERLPAGWFSSSWLKGALFLVLDHSYTADVCGTLLKYDIFYGLTTEGGDRNE